MQGGCFLLMLYISNFGGAFPAKLQFLHHTKYLPAGARLPDKHQFIKKFNYKEKNSILKFSD